MSPNDFTRLHEPQWQRLEAFLEGGKPTRRRWRRRAKNEPAVKAPAVEPASPAEFPALYRQVCQHLALARDRHYPPQLIDRLNQLALAGHQVFYASRSGLGSKCLAFVRAGFPSLVRRHAGLFWAATALCYLPGLLMALLVWLQPEMIHSLLEAEQVNDFEDMYRSGREHIGFKRDSDVNFMMFGYYIQNNISVGFRCFAGGLILGLGTVAALVFNGLLFGALTVHLSRAGFAENFFQFVVGHSAFELTAIVLCGMAGLMLGRAVIAPGRLTRREAIASEARVAVQIVYGAAGMLVVAAFIEAFWSSSTYIPPLGKYLVGAGLWLLVAGYFLFMGQRQGTVADET